MSSLPPNHSGGGLRILRTYTRLREAHGLSPSFLTLTSANYRPGWTELEGIPVFSIDPQKSLIRSLTTIFDEVRKADLVHVLGLSPQAKSIGLLSLLLRKRLVTELTMFPTPSAGSPKSRAALLPYRSSFRSIALTPGIRDWMIGIGQKPDRIWLRPNPVDTSYFAPATPAEKTAARRTFEIPDQARSHLVLGRICQRKNQLLAIQSLAQLNGDHYLVLAGPTSDSDQDYLNTLRAEIARLGLGRRVIILPEQIDDPRSLYASADSVWVPSVKEGLPNVMLEALSCGLPVLVANTVDAAYCLAEGRGLIAAPEPGAFAIEVRNLQKLSTARYKRERRRWAHSKLQIEAHCKQFAEKMLNMQREVVLQT